MAATALAEAFDGQEDDIAWIYYNYITAKGESSMKASVAYRDKTDWFKVWMVALGDTTYAEDKPRGYRATETPSDSKDYPTIGDYVATHGWFKKVGQPRADALIEFVNDTVLADPSKNPYPGWLGQGNMTDFNRNDSKWIRARAYYWLQEDGTAGATYVKILEGKPKSVVFDEVSIEKYFKDNPNLLPKTVKKYP